MKIGVYPGSFDPLTNGHMDILKRSLEVFDKVVLLLAVTDFEYEFQLAAANKFVGEDIDMVFFMASSSTTFISSSTINEMVASNVDVSPLVPPSVIKAYEAKKRK